MIDKVKEHKSLSQKHKSSKKKDAAKKRRQKNQKQKLARIMHLAQEISYNQNIDMDEAEKIARD